jgi:hypothetical protein
MTERTMLQFDWELVEEQTVSGVLGQSAGMTNDGNSRWWAVAFVLGETAVILRVDEDTDEIIVSHETLTDEVEMPWRAIVGLAEVVGRKLGWCWICRNYRGYLDGFIMSFEGIEPNWMFLAAASALYCKKLVYIDKRDGAVLAVQKS